VAGHLHIVEHLLDYGANVPISLLTSGLAEPVKDVLERHLLKYVNYVFIIIIIIAMNLEVSTH